MARIWAVLYTSDSGCSSRLEIWVNLQDGIDFTDELHANGQSGFGYRAAKLYTDHYRVSVR